MAITSAIRGRGEWVFSFRRHYCALLVFGEDSIGVGPVRQDLQGLESWQWGTFFKYHHAQPRQNHNKKNG